MGRTLIKPEGLPKQVLTVILIYTLAKEQKPDTIKFFILTYIDEDDLEELVQMMVLGHCKCPPAEATGYR